MRFESVTAHAFGPFVGRSLELAPGLNVIHGPNEAGKSSLHAALYALRLTTRHIKQSTGIQNLDSASYLSESTGLPPEPEQRAIAAFLDRETGQIDALLARKEQLITLRLKGGGETVFVGEFEVGEGG